MAKASEHRRLYDVAVDPAFARTSGIVCVLPETRAIDVIFPLQIASPEPPRLPYT